MTRYEQQERRRAVISALEAGQTIAEVSAQERLCEPYVRSIGICAGVIEAKVSKQRTTSRKMFVLAALINTDDSRVAIARRLNMSTSWVNAVMGEATAAGIAIPGRNECQP